MKPFLYGFVFFLLFIGCRKSKLNKESITEEDHLLAESSFDKILYSLEPLFNHHSYLKGDDFFLFADTSCTSLSVSPNDSVSYPKFLTLNYGTSNCLAKDGSYRRGQILIKLTKGYSNTDSITEITFDHFYLNDHRIEGIDSLINQGNNTFKIKISSGSITYPTGENILWECDRQRRKTEGITTNIDLNHNLDTPSTCYRNMKCFYDDVYQITRYAFGKNRSGRLFDVKINSPLRMQFCDAKPEITEGICDIQPENLLKKTVDYGFKSCDRVAKIQVGEKISTISLQ